MLSEKEVVARPAGVHTSKEISGLVWLASLFCGTENGQPQPYLASVSKPKLHTPGGPNND